MNAIGDLLTRRGDVGSKLERTEQELSRKRADLALAILAGGDPDKLQADISKLEQRRAALLEASGLADRLASEQSQADDFQAAEAELAAIDAELAAAALDTVRQLYRQVDELERLKLQYGRAHWHLYAGKYTGRLNGGRIGETWGLLLLVLNTVKPLRRSIELTNPAIVAEAGERRRFV